MSKKRNQHKLCYLWELCNRSSPLTEVPLIDPPAFHKFPSKASLRTTWMKICGLDENIDDVSQLHICSNHFTAGDYNNLNVRHLGGVIKLRPDAYPTKLVPRTKKATSGDVKYTPPVVNIPVEPSIKNTIEGCKDVETESAVPIDIGDAAPSGTIYTFETIFVKSEPVVACDIPNESTPKKRRYQVPRYIGDLAFRHVATRRRARATFQFVKATVKKKNHLIKMLKQQNRRYAKKIKTLEDLVGHLKQRNSTSNAVQNVNLVSMQQTDCKTQLVAKSET